MRKIPVVLSALILVAAATPGDTHAQQHKHWVVCGGNQFNTCASVDVTVEGLVTDSQQRKVTLRIMNLSGMSFGGEETYGASVFTKIGFANIGGPAEAVEGTLAMAGDLIDTDSDWRTDKDGNLPDQWVLGDGNNAGGIELDLATSNDTNSGVDNGIASQCLPSELPRGGNAFWWTDCYTEFASINYADYIEITFDVTGHWDLDGSDLLLMAQNGPDGESTQCITGAEGNCAVIPEPLGVILLGTGLAGVAGARYLRRRREEGEEEPRL